MERHPHKRHSSFYNKNQADQSISPDVSAIIGNVNALEASDGKVTFYHLNHNSDLNILTTIDFSCDNNKRSAVQEQLGRLGPGPRLKLQCTDIFHIVR